MIVYNTTSNFVAAGMFFSPVWLPSLATVSGFCATVAPILGAIWLIVQIVAKLREMRKGK
jgi:hypothetical protein